MSADSGLLGIKACIPGALECQGEGSLSPPLLSSTGRLCPPAGSVGQPNCSRVGRGCGPAPQRRQERAPLLARADVVLAVAMLRRRASTVMSWPTQGRAGVRLNTCSAARGVRANALSFPRRPPSSWLKQLACRLAHSLRPSSRQLSTSFACPAPSGRQPLPHRARLGQPQRPLAPPPPPPQPPSSPLPPPRPPSSPCPARPMPGLSCDRPGQRASQPLEQGGPGKRDRRRPEVTWRVQRSRATRASA